MLSFINAYAKFGQNPMILSQDMKQSELPRPIKIRPRMYVKHSIMYEKAAFCSPEEYNSVAWYSVPLKFDKLYFLQEFYSQINRTSTNFQNQEI